MALEHGDHVWYWTQGDLVTQDTNIPRATWFPGSDPHDPNDYLGHGKEIFNYVFHADNTVLRGQPHLTHGSGSFAWLDNNPGNLTGQSGGPDFGQYQDKFNWHNFLIFPSFQAGFDAIATLMRSDAYSALSLTAAFQKYAPSGDGGNNPVKYANDVAAALGVDPSTTVGSLDDDQLVVVQNKITAIEGSVPGDTTTWDSPDLPQPIIDLLA